MKKTNSIMLFLVMIIAFAVCVTATSLCVNDTANAVGGDIYRITYNGNGNTAGDAPFDNTPYSYNQFAGVKGKETLIKDGYAFLGWNYNDQFYYVGTMFNVTSNIVFNAVWELTAADYFEGGEGTAEDPYLIDTASQLLLLASIINNETDAVVTEGGDSVGYNELQSAHYQLTNDIDLESIEWTPIGISNTAFFAGHFDGAGHVINNLLITEYDKYLGLFGNVQGTEEMNAVIKDVSLMYNEIQITTDLDDTYAGGIVGKADYAIISGCGNFGNVALQSCDYWAALDAGGIVGSADNSSIIQCYNIGNIAADTYCISNSGGIVGSGTYLHISLSYNQGNVTAAFIESQYYQYSIAGGIAGSLGLSSVDNSYNEGSVMAKSLSDEINPRTYAGGLVGYAAGISISDCFNAGDVMVENNSTNVNCEVYSGGIVGFAVLTQMDTTIGTAISTSYNSADISASSGGCDVFIGGIIGYSTDIACTVVDCYAERGKGYDAFYGGVSPEITGGNAGATETEMKTQATYLNWDFKGETENGEYDYWGIYETYNNGYPCLMWLQPSVTYVGDYSGAIDIVKHYLPSESVTLMTPVRLGYTLDGWAETSGGEVDYEGGDFYIMPDESSVLYAVWTANNYTVAFNANGGTGIMSSQSFIYNQSQELTANTFTRDGYDFAGWNTSLDNSGTAYDDMESVANLTAILDATFTIYAIWSLIAPQIATTSGYSGIYDNAVHYISVTAIHALSDLHQFSYQWYKGSIDEANKIGTDSNALEVKNVIDTALYLCVVSISDGVAITSVIGEANVVIAKAELTEPTLVGAYTYTGSEQTATLNGFDSAKMTVAGNTQTNVGSYTITVTITDTDNYKWADGSDGSFNWVISPYSLTVRAQSKTSKANTELLELTFTVDDFVEESGSFTNNALSVNFQNTLSSSVVNDVPGKYPISRGSLAVIGDNFIIGEFIEGVYTVKTIELQIADEDEPNEVVAIIAIDEGVDPDIIIVVATTENVDEQLAIPQSKVAVALMNAYATLDQNVVLMEGNITISILAEYAGLAEQGSYEVLIIEDGVAVIKSVTVLDGLLTFVTSSLGDFAILTSVVETATGLTPGEIAGIVIGSTLVALLLAFTVLFLLWWIKSIIVFAFFITIFTKIAEALKLKKSADGWYELENKDAKHSKDAKAYITASLSVAKSATRIEALEKLRETMNK